MFIIKGVYVLCVIVITTHKVSVKVFMFSVYTL